MLPCCAIGVVIVGHSQHSADGIHACATTNERSLMSAITVGRHDRANTQGGGGRGTAITTGALNWESFAMPV